MDEYKSKYGDDDTAVVNWIITEYNTLLKHSAIPDELWKLLEQEQKDPFKLPTNFQPDAGSEALSHTECKRNVPSDGETTGRKRKRKE